MSNKAPYIADWLPQFYDEFKDPLIKINNPSGSEVKALAAYINIPGETAAIAYREISDRSLVFDYTIKLDDKDRDKLYDKTLTSRSREVNLVVRSSFVSNPSDSDWIYSIKTTTFTIARCEPEIFLEECSVVDTNEKTIELTGDPNILVLGQSNAEVTMAFEVKKKSTVKTQTISCAGVVKSGSVAMFDKVTSGVFELGVTDSRMQTVNAKLTLEDGLLIPYIPLSCSQKVDVAVSSGDPSKAAAELTISGDYFDGSFGAVNNQLELWYRYKKIDEDWSAIEQPGADLDGWRRVDISDIGFTDSRYSVTIEEEALDPTETYVFQCRAIDQVYTGTGVTTSEYPIKLQPAFDWGNNDFNFNVPVTFSNGSSPENNNFDTSVGLLTSTYVGDDGKTTGAEYVFPSDGYLVLRANWNAGRYVNATLCGSSSGGFVLTAGSGSGVVANPTEALYVRKGMRLTGIATNPSDTRSGNDARFYPLI